MPFAGPPELRDEPPMFITIYKLQIKQFIRFDHANQHNIHSSACNNLVSDSSLLFDQDITPNANANRSQKTKNSNKSKEEQAITLYRRLKPGDCTKNYSTLLGKQNQREPN